MLGIPPRSNGVTAQAGAQGRGSGGQHRATAAAQGNAKGQGNAKAQGGETRRACPRIVPGPRICYAPSHRARRRAGACPGCARPTRATENEGMGQDVFDLLVVLTLVVFAGRGFFQGFVAEVAGLVALLGGFWAAHHYHALLAPRLTAIADPSWRGIAAYVLIFLAVLIAVALVARILQKILSFSFVAWADKLAGGAVGLAKGTLLCALALLLLQKFFAQAAFMQHSRTLPYFNALIAQVRGWLPPDLLARLGL